ncbi:MAG: hypothetical protein ACRDH1_13650, partial [Actinomycetota bacterium]
APPPPSERVARATTPARDTERRGSWWSGTVRTLFGWRRPPAEESGPARQPERSSPPTGH